MKSEEKKSRYPKEAYEAAKRYVNEYGWTSVVEVRRAVEGFMETQGSTELQSSGLPCVVIWAGMSPAFADLVWDLGKDEDIEMSPGSALAYLIDGEVLGYPVAKRPPKQGYKKPHWVPVFFNASSSKRSKAA